MKALRALGLAVLVFLAFVTGAGTAVIRGWADSSVRADIVNTLDHPIRSVTIRYETCGNRAEIRLGGLEPKKAMSVRFQVCGEGSAELEATLTTGASLKGEPMYVESGSSLTFGVQAGGIVSTQGMYAL